MNDLVQSEELQLRRLEKIIDRGQQTFIEVGNALAEIRDSKLYRQTHGTFEDYCKARWGWDRRYSNRIIAASEVTANLGSTGPKTERQARPLTKLQPEQRQEAWGKAQEIAAKEDRAVTARHVEEAVDQVKPKRSPGRKITQKQKIGEVKKAIETIRDANGEFVIEHFMKDAEAANIIFDRTDVLHAAAFLTKLKEALDEPI